VTSKKPPPPQVRSLEPSDIRAALLAGIRDFQAEPVYGLFFGGVYVAGGWIMYLLLTLFGLPFLVYPLFICFAIIAPFIATGFYDVSKKRITGASLTWSGVLSSVRGTSKRDLGWMALITGFVMIIWMDIAALLFFGFMGLHAFSRAELMMQIFTTPTGLLFMTLGTLTGALISLFVFAITVVSFPLLFDRNVDFVTAMITSVKVVRENPGPMLMWWLIIAALIGFSLLTGMLGLFLTLPILGHATWHLYIRAID
jgi:uncharacterized membrane protein